MGTAPFKLCLELPVPWIDILDHHERLLLKDSVCQSGYDATFRNLGCLCPNYSWMTHCHCSKPDSLECRAGMQYVCLLGKEIVDGCKFNEMYWWYRELVNYDQSETVLYVGSYVVRGVHYAIFKSKGGETALAPALEKLGGSFLKGNIGSYVVRQCRTCYLQADDRQVQACAYSMRGYLKSMNRMMNPGSNLPSGREPGRNIKLKRFIQHGKCVPVFNYFHL